MATAVSSVSSAPVAAQASDTTATRQTASTGSDPFQTILTAAASSPQAAQATRETNQAVLNAEAAAKDEQDRRDAAQASDTRTASDAAAALLAAQLGLTQLPPNTPPATLPTSQLATDALKATNPQPTAALLGPPTQTNPLFRQAVAEAGRQNNTALPGSATQVKPPADAVPTPTTTPATQPTAQPVSTNATQTQTQVPQSANTPTLASAVADIQPGQRQVVPVVQTVAATQAPNATDATSALPTPVAAPQAPTEAPGVPNVSVGDRPGTAGDRFAAIASAASTINTNPAPVTSTVFAQALAGTDLASSTAASAANLVPTQLAAPSERRQEARDARDSTQTAAVAPTFSTAPAPNSVTAAQTATAVRTPDPVAQVADGIITHAHVATRAGETEFRMRLDPPELGPVKIRLTSDGDSIHGQVVVSNDAIRRMIESQLPELRQRLEAAGVTVQNLDVSTDANPGAGADSGTAWGGYRAEFPSAPSRQSASPLAARAGAARGAGAIDVMA